jgi:hypothetical protein
LSDRLLFKKLQYSHGVQYRRKQPREAATTPLIVNTDIPDLIFGMDLPKV